MMSKYFMAFV